MLSRRSVLGGASASALVACSPQTHANGVKPTPLRPLKDTAPFPVGTCAMSGQFADPVWNRLALTHFNQITPEWEMKMEYILSHVHASGRYHFEAPDRIAAFCQAHGLGLHGTTLIWYAQGQQEFGDLSPEQFRHKFDHYITTVTSRYRGKVRGWDVINEAVAEDGNGLRQHHWSEALGETGHMVRAFELAHQADPEAVLFINDYNLENNPTKGDTFLRLVERLLKAGAPIGGIGTQSHLDIEIPAGQISRFIGQAGQFGLPVHISELDASKRRDGRRPDLRTVSERTNQQIDRVKELTEAFHTLPARQRYGLTLWGVRDTDSWLRRPPHDDGRDSPLAFDASGQATQMAYALAEGWQ